MTQKRFVCYFDDTLKKWCVQNTNSLDMYYVADEPMGEEFAHLLNLYQQTLDRVEKENWQLKEEIKDLNDILARYEERVLKERTNHNEKDCGHCKHLQIDGMFGMWCEKKHNWTEVKYCKDYER